MLSVGLKCFVGKQVGEIPMKGGGVVGVMHKLEYWWLNCRRLDQNDFKRVVKQGLVVLSEVRGGGV